MHVKKGDNVKILAGKDKGKTGVISKAFPKEGKVIVTGINTVKKHVRAQKKGSTGQVVDREMPLNVSKVAKVK